MIVTAILAAVIQTGASTFPGNLQGIRSVSVGLGSHGATYGPVPGQGGIVKALEASLTKAGILVPPRSNHSKYGPPSFLLFDVYRQSKNVGPSDILLVHLVSTPGTSFHGRNPGTLLLWEDVRSLSTGSAAEVQSTIVAECDRFLGEWRRQNKRT